MTAERFTTHFALGSTAGCCAGKTSRNTCSTSMTCARRESPVLPSIRAMLVIDLPAVAPSFLQAFVKMLVVGHVLTRLRTRDF